LGGVRPFPRRGRGRVKRFDVEVRHGREDEAALQGFLPKVKNGLNPFCIRKTKWNDGGGGGVGYESRGGLAAKKIDSHVRDVLEAERDGLLFLDRRQGGGGLR
jgi:hypothetical protein